MMKIMKTLGLNIVATQKVEVQINEDVEPTPAESQAMEMLNAANSKGNNT